MPLPSGGVHSPCYGGFSRGTMIAFDVRFVTWVKNRAQQAASS